MSDFWNGLFNNDDGEGQQACLQSGMAAQINSYQKTMDKKIADLRVSIDNIEKELKLKP